MCCNTITVSRIGALHNAFKPLKSSILSNKKLDKYEDKLEKVREEIQSLNIQIVKIDTHIHMDRQVRKPNQIKSDVN